jgi:dTDP-4-amino-4,6-dideoxygalactose transaminase
MIPFVDLRKQYLEIKRDVDAAIARVFDSGQFVLGEEVEAFEREFAELSGAADGIAVNSGTSALQLALMAAGVRQGDEVITVPFTFVATAAAVGYIGAKPVFVDIDPVTFTMDPSKIEAAITPRTRAIVPVHLYGQPADMDPILEIAARYDLVVIEDACQAHAAAYKGRPVGSLGHAAAFSFYPGKNLGAYGEGGMVVTSRPEITREVRMLRDWGSERKYHHVLKGYNFRMDGIQGAILRAKLRHLARWTQLRREHARTYGQLLADSGLGLPVEADYARHVYHVYAVRTSDRASLQRLLQAHGVSTGIHYPVPVHLQPAWADLGYKAGDFPESERAAAEVLSLPMFPELTHTQIEIVAAAVRQESYVV